MGKQKYFTEEERLEARKEYLKRYRHENAEKERERVRRWREENPEKEREKQNKYNKTPIGRAGYLVKNYKREDKKYNRGECTLTAQWIVDNIFTKPCHYNCGETDWKKIGCDRINNELPHTPDNVIPCCTECNKKRQKMDYETFKNTFISNNITN